MSLLNNITEEVFSAIVKLSFSKAEVIKAAGLNPVGANYRAFDILVQKWNVDTSHFSGQSHLKGKTHNWSPKIALKDILVKDSTYQSNKLRKRLIEEKVLEERCNRCYNTSWMGNKIPLELEHINGNKFDNRLKNLELLCPNCHAQTSTYRGKNMKKARIDQLAESSHLK